MVRAAAHTWETQQKVQAAYVADLRQEIATIKSYQTAVDKKVAVALRFVDWFTDVKLNKGGGGGGGGGF